MGTRLEQNIRGLRVDFDLHRDVLMSPSTQPRESDGPRVSDALHAQDCSSIAWTSARRKLAGSSDRKSQELRKNARNFERKVERQLDFSESYIRPHRRV